MLGTHPLSQNISAGSEDFSVRLATTAEDRRAAQRLRYDVFVRELGGDGPLVDHESGLEMDHLDPFFDHLLLLRNSDGAVVGAYRLMRSDAAARAGGFYSAAEYDLSALSKTGRRMLELGRSCIHRDYRGGTALHLLWTGLADYIAAHRIEILFGVASFHGTDPAQLAAPLSLLHHRHLAPIDLRVTAHGAGAHRMDLLAQEKLDRREAMLQVPGLIKAYLRLGGFVGQGAFVDHDFNTTDVCLILDVARMSPKQARMYQGASA